MKFRKIALLSAALLIPYSLPTPCSLLAQEQDIKDPLLRWMNNIAQDQLQARQRFPNPSVTTVGGRQFFLLTVMPKVAILMYTGRRSMSRGEASTGGEGFAEAQS